MIPDNDAYQIGKKYTTLNTLGHFPKENKEDALSTQPRFVVSRIDTQSKTSPLEVGVGGEERENKNNGASACIHRQNLRDPSIPSWAK